MRLLVWGLLKKGACLHWLMIKAIYIKTDGNTEIYIVPRLTILLLDCVEFICGYTRIKYPNNSGLWYYTKYV
jgi:hypothetical protein